ncbi:hypothetical protein Thiowin_03551 [Thiorhodovibrio winogradskyi]|uniref:Uncharacterized protein n=1 Tax=Thiorhodovibrio winogradskyi TaxID=77007 RepID=A0ABZ0SDU6_9GAMM
MLDAVIPDARGDPLAVLPGIELGAQVEESELEAAIAVCQGNLSHGAGPHPGTQQGAGAVGKHRGAAAGE